MKNKLIKILSAAAVAFSMFMALGWSFFDLMIHCRNRKRETRKKWFQLSHTRINHPRDKFEKEYEEGKAWCREQKMQDCYVRTADGLLLHGSYLPAERAERFVLLCHGYKGSGFGDFAYTARFLHENGCNLLFIDQRCCGLSEGKYITFGAKEQWDVQEWAYYIARRNKAQLPIYLYGESMGASSVLMASGHNLPKEVKGLIADCGFHSMKEQLQDIAANWFHMNWVELLLFRVDVFCRLLGGFHMKDADTANAMRTNRRPVLFFHGEKDTYVEPKNTRYNYALCRAPKELVIVPEARHLCSAYVNPGLYRRKLLEFFAKYDE
ncbi:MAG: alpha/beta hydrolase [Lachnospiraceae bacterium]|nr:alpha/beta hydrolase [Lachnospiraceae bacterium]